MHGRLLAEGQGSRFFLERAPSAPPDAACSRCNLQDSRSSPSLKPHGPAPLAATRCWTLSSVFISWRRLPSSCSLLQPA